MSLADLEMASRWQRQVYPHGGAAYRAEEDPVKRLWLWLGVLGERAVRFALRRQGLELLGYRVRYTEYPEAASFTVSEVRC